MIDRPAHSPDLNPIEPVWRLLKLKIFELYPELGDMGRSQKDWEQSKRAIAHAWDVLDQSVIDGLIRSVPKRIEAVRIAQGYYTRY
jgi:transposase